MVRMPEAIMERGVPLYYYNSVSLIEYEEWMKGDARFRRVGV